MREFDMSAIKKLRESQNLTLAEFASKLGIRPQAAHSLENGSGKPNIKTIERLMNVFEVDESYFFTMTSNANSH